MPGGVTPGFSRIGATCVDIPEPLAFAKCDPDASSRLVHQKDFEVIADFKVCILGLKAYLKTVTQGECCFCVGRDGLSSKASRIIARQFISIIAHQLIRRFARNKRGG